MPSASQAFIVHSEYFFAEASPVLRKATSVGSTPRAFNASTSARISFRNSAATSSALTFCASSGGAALFVSARADSATACCVATSGSCGVCCGSAFAFSADTVPLSACGQSCVCQHRFILRRAISAGKQDFTGTYMGPACLLEGCDAGWPEDTHAPIFTWTEQTENKKSKFDSFFVCIGKGQHGENLDEDIDVDGCGRRVLRGVALDHRKRLGPVSPALAATGLRRIPCAARHKRCTFPSTRPGADAVPMRPCACVHHTIFF